jgi:hypothetical protein
VDDRVHPAKIVDLIGEPAGLFIAREVAHDYGRSPIGEIRQCGRPLWIACVDNYLVTVIYQVRGG